MVSTEHRQEHGGEAPESPQRAAVQNETGAHTPGPWSVMEGWPLEIVPAAHVARSLGASIYPEQDAEYAQPIAQARFDAFTQADKFPHRRVHRAEAMANARLIAAAPELLAALIECADQIENGAVGMGAVHAANRARAVIAKATGSQS